ncbi:MAG TPA: hypothetical protein VGJ43_10925 [Acidimicrobiales bacterium]|jgi:hypothetical protein
MATKKHWSWLKKRWERLCARLKTGSIARKGATFILVALVAAPMVVVMTVGGGDRRPSGSAEVCVGLLKAGTVGVLAFFPGWLFVRFLGQRAGALWTEYVLNLHRLAWDDPGNLPEPPGSSSYYAAWAAGRAGHEGSLDIYRQKFDAYYGRSVADAAGADDFTVKTETMLPVFMATLVLSTGWTAVLWDDSFAAGPATVWDVLKFAFVGAYIFSVQSLIRRFFQSDLRPSAYASLLVRFAVVLSAMLALHQLLDIPTRTEAAIAFVVGIFPTIALQALERAAEQLLGVVVQQSTADYPLSQIDGLDLWYQARLVEEGIEDMQNLATANLVDVMLHTRVPVDRLIDWVDQAHLYLHLDHAETGLRDRWRIDRRLHAERSKEGVESAVHERIHGSASLQSRAGTRTRVALRQIGIRTATDLLRVFPTEAAVVDGTGVDKLQLQILVRSLTDHPGLVPVWNWKARGVKLATGSTGPDLRVA